MRPEAHIQTTIELLEEFSVQSVPFKRFFPAYVRNRRYIGSKDRKAIFAYAMGIFRHYFNLIRSCSALSLNDDFRSLMLIYLKLAAQKDNADIGQLFSGGYGPAPLTDEESQALELLSHGEGFELSLEAPDFILPTLLEYYGESIFKELAFMSQNILPAYFRVNPHKADIDEVTEKLIEANLPIMPQSEEQRLNSPCPHLLYFFENIDLSQHPLYKQGIIEVQDKGSQMLCNLVTTKAGENLWDFCAGGGGKSLYIQSCEPSLKVILSDIHKVKLENAKQRFKRAGLKLPESLILPDDLENMSHLRGKIDHMLLDVPCSSVGTWQRNPDLKLRMTEDYLAQIIQTQRDILTKAAPFVKSGGRLYYFTCSLLPQENDEQISWFLESHPDFKEIPITQEYLHLDNSSLFPYDKQKNSLTISPQAHNSDGFFVAILERNGSR